MLAATANPEHPNEVQVSRPSDALAAKQATDATFTALLLGLGAVALLVGGVGVANTMVISVLERRAEIGLRRVARRHPGPDPAAVPGRVAAAVRARRGRRRAARHRGDRLRRHPGLAAGRAGLGAVGGLVATLVIGALAGLYPAVRASRLAPTEALSDP